MKRVRLKTTRDGGEPVVWRKMVRGADPGTANGEVVEVVDAKGRVLGRGFFNRKSQIAVRLLERGPGPDLDDAWLAGRLQQALALRRSLGVTGVTDAFRLVNAEGDGLGGLIVDVYADVVAVQVLALGWYRRAVALKDALQELLRPRAIVVRSDAEIERIEGFRVHGRAGREARTVIEEHGLQFAVDAAEGHKTGFFLDQRDQRRRVRDVAGGRRVLDLCGYTGGFALNAARGGARRVRLVDLDETAVAGARDNAERNGLAKTIEFEHADAFDALRDTRRGDFDLIVCDPPKFATGKGSIGPALAKYRDLAALCFDRVAPGGMVVSCSCSGLVAEPEFLEALQRGARHVGREVRVLSVGGAAPDHPWDLAHPAGRYLKVVWAVAGPHPPA